MTTRRNLLTTAAGIASVSGTVSARSANVSPGASVPDAELIALCARHIANMKAFNEGPSVHLDGEVGLLSLAYDESRDAVSDAVPQTLAGMVAKARAAKAEAMVLNGTEDPEGSMAAVWAWDLVGDLLRLVDSQGI